MNLLMSETEKRRIPPYLNGLGNRPSFILRRMLDLDNPVTSLTVLKVIVPSPAGNKDCCFINNSLFKKFKEERSLGDFLLLNLRLNATIDLLDYCNLTLSYRNKTLRLLTTLRFCCFRSTYVKAFQPQRYLYHKTE